MALGLGVLESSASGAALPRLRLNLDGTFSVVGLLGRFSRVPTDYQLMVHYFGQQKPGKNLSVETCDPDSLMKISDLSIRRPVLASMLSLALVLFGVIGYTQLAVREFPDVDAPIVSVSTVLPGANPQVVESAVTDILEEELSTVEGLRTLTSSSG